MQRKQKRMRLSFENVTCHAEHFVEAYSESCQVSDMELFAKTVNDLKQLKTVIAKSSTLGI